MEKHANTRRTKYLRLLISFLLLMLNTKLFSQNNIDAYLCPSETKCFKGEQITFSILVPNTSPSEVKFIQKTLQTGITQVFTSKTTNTDENELNRITSESTKIELTYQFNKTGTFKLPEITIQKGLKKQILTFPEITVTENPARMPASCFWTIVPNKEVLKSDDEIELNLCIRYTTEVLSVSIPLQEDILLISKVEQKEPSENFETLSSSENGTLYKTYIFTPLEYGKIHIPEATLSVIGTNGKKQILTTPEKFITIKKSETATPINAFEFKEIAFNTDDSTTVQKEQNPTSFLSEKEKKEKIQKIAYLRSLEKKALFNKEIKTERVKAENELEIFNSPNEFPILILFISLIFLFFSLLFTIFSIASRKTTFNKIFCIITMSCFLAISIFSFTKYTVQKGVFIGGSVQIIPDESSSLGGSLPCGSVVIIEKNINGWLLIKSGKTFSGWVNSNKVCLIGEKAE